MTRHQRTDTGKPVNYLIRREDAFPAIQACVAAGHEGLNFLSAGSLWCTIAPSDDQLSALIRANITVALDV